MSTGPRRRFLAAVGAALASTGAGSGCLRGPGPRAATDPWREFERVEEGERQGIRGVVDLRRGEFAVHAFAVPENVRFTLRGRERLALPVDLLTMRRAYLDRYRRGEDVPYLSVASALRVDGVVREGQLLPEGAYAFVVDNTRLGEARPLDAVTVSVELTYVP